MNFATSWFKHIRYYHNDVILLCKRVIEKSKNTTSTIIELGVKIVQMLEQDKNQLLADPPITSKKQDRLGRTPLAEKVALMTNKFKGVESFVIGIEGEWGSGKTSFIELVLENLTNKKSNWKIIRFNPWNFFSIKALYQDFFAELGKALGNREVINFGKKILGQIELAPTINLWIIKISLGKWKNSEKSLNDIKTDIGKQLVEDKAKLLIVIDDIDRLDKDEAREIFKLVKVNANFPNTVFMLAYDRLRVVDMLSKAGFPGGEYLKKIIQVSFVLPKPEPNQIYEVLGEKLDSLLDTKGLQKSISNYWDKKRWGNLYLSGFKDVFKTIRDIKRFVSSWLLDYLIVGYDEVNPIDFLGIELIRVFAPDVYISIAENKELFTKLDSSVVGVRDNRQERLKDVKKILDKSPEELKVNITEVCKKLFPQVDGLFTNTHYTYDWTTKWRQALRICSEDHFSTYFLLSVPTGKVAQSDLNFLINSLSRKSEFLNQLKQIGSNIKLKTTLDYLFDKLDKLSRTRIIRLIEELLLFGETLEEEPAPGFENTSHRIRKLCYHALKRVKENERGSVIKSLFKKTSAVYASIFFVGYLISEYEDFINKKDTDKPLIEKEKDIQDFENIAVLKIKAELEVAKKIPEKHLAAFLLWLNRFKHSNNVKKYIGDKLNTKSGILEILRAFKTAYFSTGLGDYVSTKHDKIDTKSLEALIGLDKIDKAIKRHFKIRTDKKDKEILELYEKSKNKGDFG